MQIPSAAFFITMCYYMVSLYVCLLIFCMFFPFLSLFLAGDRFFYYYYLFFIERFDLQGTFRNHLVPTTCCGPSSYCKLLYLGQGVRTGDLKHRIWYNIRSFLFCILIFFWCNSSKKDMNCHASTLDSYHKNCVLELVAQK